MTLKIIDEGTRDLLHDRTLALDSEALMLQSPALGPTTSWQISHGSAS